jgi:hypothetical protein
MADLATALQKREKIVDRRVYLCYNGRVELLDAEHNSRGSESEDPGPTHSLIAITVPAFLLPGEKPTNLSS